MQLQILAKIQILIRVQGSHKEECRIPPIIMALTMILRGIYELWYYVEALDIPFCHFCEQ